MTEINSNASHLKVRTKIFGSTELDHTWKSTVRERQKVQDNRVWEEFSKNEDNIVKTVPEGTSEQYEPYQYLNILPFTAHNIDKIEKHQNSSDTDEPVSIANKDEVDMQYASGDRILSTSTYDEDEFIPFIEEPIEDELATDLNVAAEPTHPDREDTVRRDESTIRENIEHSEDKDIAIEHTNEYEYYLSNHKKKDKTEVQTKNQNVQCNENLDSKRQTNTFQSSIYFEKVKGTRVKINEILYCIIELFENETSDNYDHDDLKKFQRRANEFSGRFTRIYVYQLQKQLNDLRRHMSVSLPFGKRTQYLAQATRVMSLHQNTHQALQMLHHSLDTCLWLGERGQPLQALLDLLRDATDTCRELAPSHDLQPKLRKLYDDEIVASCTKLEQLIQHHLRSMQVLMDTAQYGSKSKSPRNKSAHKEREMKQTHTQYRQKLSFVKQRDKYSPRCATTDARLSMYSLDKVKPNVKPKFPNNNKFKLRLDQGTDKPGSSLSQTNVNKQNQNKSDKKSIGQKKEIKQVKEDRKSKTGSRKPLMRAGSSAPARRGVRKKIPEEDIETMVESVQSSSPVRENLKFSTPKTPIDSPKSLTTAALPSERSATTAAAGAGGSPRARGAARSCDVTALLHRICGTAAAAAAAKAAEAGGERPLLANRVMRVSGASNAQLLCVTRDSPRRSPRSPRSSAAPATNTPQLLKILEETIQKQPLGHKTEAQSTVTEDGKSIPDKFLLHFDTPERVVQNANDYRKAFLGYMMSNPMYANSTFKKPWDVVGQVSDKIIEEMLLNCALEMQLENVLLDLYNVELNN